MNKKEMKKHLVEGTGKLLIDKREDDTTIEFNGSGLMIQFMLIMLIKRLIDSGAINEINILGIISAVLGDE